jgi:hypothetical protein
MGSAAVAKTGSSISSSLLLRARAHDPEAWRRLVRVYGPLIYSWCRRAGLQAADAADVDQEVYLCPPSVNEWHFCPLNN